MTVAVIVAIERDTCELLCLAVPKAGAARRRLPSPEALDGWAAGAKALGDPTRLAVTIALAESGTACVCDLAWIVARDEKLVSHHRELDLVSACEPRSGETVPVGADSALLELDGREVAERGVPAPAVVEGFDVVEDLAA
jgi:hypothetical protein